LTHLDQIWHGDTTRRRVHATFGRLPYTDTEERAAEESASRTSSSATESAQRSSNHQSGRGSGGEGNGKGGAQDSPSKSKRQPASTSSRPTSQPLEQLMKMTQEVTASTKGIQLKVDNLERPVNSQPPAPAVSTQASNVHVSRPSTTTAGATSTTSWEQTGVYQPMTATAGVQRRRERSRTAKGSVLLLQLRVDHFKPNCPMPVNHDTNGQHSTCICGGSNGVSTSSGHAVPELRHPGWQSAAERVYLNYNQNV